MNLVNDTIVAPATAITTQAIALIRISGDEAFNILNKLLQKPINAKGVFVRKIFDNNTLVDEVVITTFQQPNSFTGEDTIELAIHGGVLNTNRIISLIINHGARMANRGEFSQRAFLNGKINLIQAEGINDLIHATNNLALNIGISNMSGSNNKAIEELKAMLMDMISRIQVSIDYPDYDDVEGSTVPELIVLLEKMTTKVNDLLIRSKLANKATQGIKTAIIGKTNVGKSSLLNTLLNEDKAIVTDIPGTTRDIVEGQISLENVTLNLIDTAGIRKTTDKVEEIGISKSKDYINKADLVLFVINYEDRNDQENLELLKLLESKQYITVINKKDQLQEINNSDLNNYKNVVYTSAIQDLKNVSFINQRAEEFSIENKEKYDIVISRAVAYLDIILEIGVQLLKVGGTFILLKGPRADEELANLKGKEIKMGLNFVNQQILPDTGFGKRVNLFFNKEKQTSNMRFMGLQVGIVGLPNVGKSTLFNAITNSKVEAANYPFATIEPNVGVVEKKVATTIEFVDIAGLIAGASKGEGLGNAFLTNIRETDAICQVVRCFDDKDITHVEGRVDPISDIEIINLELMLADEATVKKRLERILPKVRGGDKVFKQEHDLLTRLLECLDKGNLLNTLELTDEENKLLRGFNLLTSKPFIYVANVGDQDILNDNKYVQDVREFAAKTNTKVVKICAKIEEDLSEVPLEEKKDFLVDLGITQSGLDA
ncbi:hypothetical protein FQA39_LY13020 [Lamprigera yunnana]|nr:hypothetical protein FQA39_LY13020 [Lamprigera yunnana]